MPRVELPIANGFYESPNTFISNQACVNWFVNEPQAPALSQGTLFGTPGLTQLATSGTVKQENRGARSMGGNPYFVNGGNLYRLNQVIEPYQQFSYNMEDLGPIEGTGRVSMTENGVQLYIQVPGGKGYIYTVAGGLVEITDAGFTANGAPQYVTYANGYFVATTDEKKFIISGFEDGLSWNALDFGTAAVDTDSVVAPYTYRGQLYIFGLFSVQAFQFVVTTDFPFVPVGGFVLDKGLFSPSSIVETGGRLMWIGGGRNEQPAIFTMEGANAVKLSTTAIDSILARRETSVPELSGAYGMEFALQGGYFAIWTIGNVTLAYNTITGKWNECSSRVGSVDQEWRVADIVTGYDNILCSDSIDGRIGSLSENVYTEYGELIIRRFSTMPFANNGNSFSISALELTMNSGMEGSIMMRYSDDSKRFSDRWERSIGGTGNYQARQIWYKQGRAPRFRVYEFQLSEPVDPTIIKLEANMRANRG